MGEKMSECLERMLRTTRTLSVLCDIIGKEPADMPKEEWQELVVLSDLVGTQQETGMRDEWKEKIWRCPSCKFWFTVDWNHDDEVCCACAGCTKHPFLGKFVECRCERCVKNRELRADNIGNQPINMKGNKSGCKRNEEQEN